MTIRVNCAAIPAGLIESAPRAPKYLPQLFEFEPGELGPDQVEIRYGHQPGRMWMGGYSRSAAKCHANREETHGEPRAMTKNEIRQTLRQGRRQELTKHKASPSTHVR